MYIALKWLVGLALAMWFAMCSVDFCLKRKNGMNGAGFTNKPLDSIFVNLTNPVEKKLVNDKGFKTVYEKQDIAVLHCTMFAAGALAVSLFNRKTEIISYTKSKLGKHIRTTLAKIREYLKITGIIIGVAISKYIGVIWVNMKIYFPSLSFFLQTMKTPKPSFNNAINVAFLQKIKEIGEERKKLGQLLIAAIHENKNIRLQYQLENLAKNRLVRHIEDTQKQIKENRSRYVSFQHLYLVTHQENIFLKARIRKLTNEKDEAEKNLMTLMNEIYKTKNNELKAYCSRFIVKTKDNLLNSDVGEEIQKFLHKSKGPEANRSAWQFSKHSAIDISATRSLPRCSNSNITEIIQEDSLVTLVSDAPKLKGLPGECIWTIKDKDGIIEKLYEYDYESDFDNGDTIRRIREYSVYHDKDCLLDFASSRTLIHSTSSQTTSLHDQYFRENYPIAKQRIVTGSDAFKKFLQTNKNIVSTTRSYAPPLLIR